MASIFDDDDSQPDFDAEAEVNRIFGGSGMAAGETDAANLAAKNPEDRAQFIADLTAQRNLRAASNGGNGGSASPSSGGGTSGGPSVPQGSGAPQSIQPFTREFNAPTIDSVRNSGTFQFRLGEAINAIKKAGLAKGTFFTNQTAKALEEQASGIGSDEYDKQYDRSMGEFLTGRDTHFLNEEGRYGSQRTNRVDDWGQATDIFGMGRTNRMDDNTIRLSDQSILDSNRGFDRLMQNDQWGRGADLWNMNRTDRQDDFSNNLTIEQMRNQYRPRPS